MTLATTLDADPGSGTVTFRFTVENDGSEPVELQYRTGQDADVAVYESGTERWRWSDGRMFTQAVRTDTLGPGEATTVELTWENPAPGSYEAEASLAADAEASARTAFEVPTRE